MLEKFAKTISNNEGTGEKQVNSDTAEVTLAMGKETYTIGIGDTFTLDGKKVRLLGFNHDELVDKTVYGGNNTHAGISLEYIDSLLVAGMNTTRSNEGGWGKSNMRVLLNGTTESIKNSQYEILKNKVNIKKVKKEYCADYTSSEISYSEDYLWLLSSEEIGDGGYTVRHPLGHEGKIYCFYQKNYFNYIYGDPKNPVRNSDTFLRSMPSPTYPKTFCEVSGHNGFAGTQTADLKIGNCPGFAI